MEWKNVPEVWQECFNEAWKSFLEDSRPIGAVVTDRDGVIIARGKSAVFNSLTASILSNNELAHAEINALLQLDNRVHTARNTYTLLSTMEPCPLCFGAFYMSGIRNLKYAARDNWAGSTNLQDASPYMSLKPIQVEGPFSSLEQLSLVLNMYFELKINPDAASKVTQCWTESHPDEAALAAQWFHEKTLECHTELAIGDVFTMLQHEMKLSSIK